MYYVIDRIEGIFAICESMTPEADVMEIEIKKLPSDIKEGDIIKYENGFVIDKAMTEKRKTKLAKMYGGLWKT